MTAKIPAPIHEALRSHYHRVSIERRGPLLVLLPPTSQLLASSLAPVLTRSTSPLEVLPSPLSPLCLEACRHHCTCNLVYRDVPRSSTFVFNPLLLDPLDEAQAFSAGTREIRWLRYHLDFRLSAYLAPRFSFQTGRIRSHISTNLH